MITKIKKLLSRRWRNREMNIIRKMSADKLFDEFLMIFQNNENIRKEFPTLENEIKFHRNNYYKVIEQLKNQ